MTDHEAPVEFFGQAVRLDPFRIKLGGPFPFPCLLVMASGLDNGAEQPVFQRFATGQSPW